MAILDMNMIRAYFMLDLSTAHLPLETVEQIERGEFYRDPYLRSDYGFVFQINEYHTLKECERELSECPCPAFRAALKIAWKYNLRFIMYDQDAEPHFDVEELPIYEW
ncbi:hypothetical protein [Ruegeria sp. HKCCA6837]|uniref:DUF5983 family protein n=1 Tax=Ruegeria sp. HKCCA6837 TaxID=2682989 RepID=UPI00148A05E8|nr:hypothetical protein [Ruegeria sp. HKCCA6837]